MAAITSNRDGWTGILVPEPIASITATSQANGFVGRAVPSTGNGGTATLKSTRIGRSADPGDVTLLTSRGGSINSSDFPADLTVQTVNADVDTINLGWMDPSVSWGHQFVGNTIVNTRICRWGGSRGFVVDPLLSRTTTEWLNVDHDVCPGGDRQALQVQVIEQGTRFIIQTYRYDRDISQTVASTSFSQVIDSSALAPSTHDVGSVRVGYRNGSGLLIIQARTLSSPQDRLHQFASSDGGGSWSYVGSTADTAADAPWGCADVEGNDSGFFVCVAHQDDSSDKVRVYRVQSPQTPVWSGAYATVDHRTYLWNDGTSGRVQALLLSLTTSETGDLYLIGLTYNGSGSGRNEGITYISRDSGLSWSQVVAEDNGVQSWLPLDVGIARPSASDACWVFGGVIVGYLASGNLYALRLGGWSQYAPTTPAYGGDTAIRGEVGLAASCAWDRVYVPWGFIPSLAGWTASLAGSPSETLTDDKVTYAGTAGARSGVSWKVGSTSSTDNRHTARAKIMLKPNAGYTSHESPAFVDFQLCDTTETYRIRIAIGNDAVRAYALGGLGYVALGAAESHTFGSNKVEWYIWARLDFTAPTSGLRQLHLTIVGRDATSDSMGTRGKADWTFSTTIQTDLSKLLYDRSGTTLTAEVEWGSYLQTGESCEWYDVFFSTTYDLGSPQDPSEGVQGRPVAGALVQVYPDILIKPEGGIAAIGDSWSVATEYEGSIENALDPTLSLRWDAGVRTTQTIEVALEEPVSGPILGLLLRDMVVENLKVEVMDSTGVYTEVVSYGDFLLGGMRATRILGLYTPKAGTGQTTTRQYWEDELTGSAVVFDNKIRTITANSQGSWDPTFSGRKATIRASYDGVSATEGVLRVIPNSIFVLVNVSDMGAVPAVRITYQAGTSGSWPTSASWKLGRILVGDVHVMGDDPSWGRNITTEVLTEENELPSGRNRPRAKLPPRRRCEISWQDGVDTTRSMDGESPDYLEIGSGAAAIANVGGSPWHLEGILRKVNGSEGEVVLLPRIPAGETLVDPGSSMVLNRRRDFIHGRLGSQVVAESVQGEENSTEVIRVNTVTITEVV